GTERVLAERPDDVVGKSVPRGEGLDLPVAAAGEAAAVGADPEGAVPGTKQREHGVVRQPVLHREVREATVLQPVEPPAVGPDPEGAVVVLFERAHDAVAEPVLRVVHGEAAVAKRGEAVDRADPERSRAVFVKYADDVTGETVQGPVARELAVAV